MTERELVQAYRGCSVESRAFAEASDAYPWDGLWPVIGGDLCLTGEIADAGDSVQYLNYRDVAMIRLSDAMTAGWRIDYPDDGYGEPGEGGSE